MSLPPKRLAAEAIPVAAVLTFWSIVSWLFSLHPEIEGTVKTAGVVMAALYVVVRGVALASEVSVPDAGDLEAVLRDNGRVAISAGFWFVGAAAIYLLEQAWSGFGVPGLHVSPAGWIIHVLAGAGLGVVGLYAVAVSYGVLRGAESPGVAPADD